MSDPRRAQLARTIVRHSTRLEKDEVVLIESIDLSDGLVCDLIEEIHAVEAIPILHLRRNALTRQLLIRGYERQMALQAEIEMFQMKKAQAYVGIRAADRRDPLAERADRLIPLQLARGDVDGENRHRQGQSPHQ